jgi:hypothetical protein
MDSIPFNATTKHISGGKGIPIDKPFIIVVDHLRNDIDLNRVNSVYCFSVSYKNGKPDLTCDKKDLGTCQSKADIKIDYDTADKKLILFFPALKPDIDFDINIQQNFSDKNLDLFYDILKDFQSGDNASANKKVNDLILHFKQARIFATDIGNLYFTSAAQFQDLVYQQVKPDLSNILDNTKYMPVGPIGPANIQDAYKILRANKGKCPELPFLGLFDPANTDNIAKGLVSLKGDNKFELIDTNHFNDRLYNLTSTITLLVTIDSAVRTLYLESLDPQMATLQQIVDNNIKAIRSNLKNFKQYLDGINKAINAKGFESVWLVGTTQSNDLKTKGGSLVSTDLGIANIVIRDNYNKLKYIPKLYLGLNIFFRPVDRNASLKYLPASKKAANDKFHNHTDSVDDNLSATRTILQHLSLSVGVTFGTMDVRYFDNLFNGMSLVIGPSYRFARAFRITSGVALLKRVNPNPLLTTEVVTAGFYASFSVDFDFLSTVKNFTDLIK